MIDSTEKVLTVSQLTKAIKETLEMRFLSLCVKGEITNLKIQSSGHVYFSLKDDQAQIAAVIFKSVYQKLKNPIKIGDKVVVYGQLNIYPPRGSYQIIIQKLHLEGLGDLLLKFHELKKQLLDKGYFDENHKKSLPKFPKVIGVVTSPTGSVIQDIINILSRRFKGCHLILNPVKVQGVGSEKEISQAIKDFNRFNLADVLIIGRGGGSLEDLWAFNEECVAQAIYESTIPIISAIGHETDFTIADLVADVRAPTPSAAAEIVIQATAEHLEHLSKSLKILQGYMTHAYHQAKLKILSILKQPVISNPETTLFPYAQKIDEKISKIDQLLKNNLALKNHSLTSLKKQLNTYRPSQFLDYHKEKKYHYATSINRSMFQHFVHNKQKLETLKQSIHSKFLEIFKEKKNKFMYLKDLLSSIDPKNILKKGYCIPFAENKNSVIISAHEIHEGDNLRLMFSDGIVHTKATNKK